MSMSRPIAFANSALPSASIITLSPAPLSLPHASITNASFTEMHAIRSTPFALMSLACAMKPGRCCIEQVGVNAPGTANSTVFLPANSSPVETSCILPSTIVLIFTSGTFWPTAIGMEGCPFFSNGERSLGDLARAHERRDRLLEAVDREMEHREHARDRRGRARRGPAAFGVGIEPDAALEVVGDPLEPDDPGGLGLAARIDVAERAHELVRVHRRVADDRHLPALVELPEQIAGRDGRASEQARVAVDVLVDTVVEVVGTEVAQPARGVQRGEQPRDRPVVGIHRSA